MKVIIYTMILLSVVLISAIPPTKVVFEDPHYLLGRWRGIYTETGFKDDYYYRIYEGAFIIKVANKYMNGENCLIDVVDVKFISKDKINWSMVTTRSLKGYKWRLKDNKITVFKMEVTPYLLYYPILPIYVNGVVFQDNNKGFYYELERVE